MNWFFKILPYIPFLGTILIIFDINNDSYSMYNGNFIYFNIKYWIIIQTMSWVIFNILVILYL